MIDSSDQMMKNTSVLVTVFAIIFSEILFFFLICSDSFNIPYPNKIFILRLFILISTLGCFTYTFTIDINKDERIIVFLKNFGLLSPPYLLIIMMCLTQSTIVFLLCLIQTVAAVIFIDIQDKQNERFQDILTKNIIKYVYVVWVVVGIFITLGTFNFSPYAKTISKYSNIFFFLDMRYLISTIFFIMIAIKSLLNAFDEGTPAIDERNIKTLNLKISLIFQPIVIFINSFLIISQKIINILRKRVLVFFVYFYRTTRHSKNYVIQLILNEITYKSLVQVFGTFLIISVYTYATSYIAPHVYDYLTNASVSTILFSIKVLIPIAIFIIITFFVIFPFVYNLWFYNLWYWRLERYNIIIEHITQSVMYFFITLFLSSIFMYLLSYLFKNIRGFSNFGILSIFILVLFVIVLFWQHGEKEKR